MAVVFEAISNILAVRFFLLGAVVGSFVLGWKVTDLWSAGAFAGFTAVALAMIALEYRTRGK